MPETSHVRTKCLITGCGLAINPLYVWGDLHSLGDCYIFNAVLNHQGEPSWVGVEEREGERYIRVLEGADYFERRGVFIIPKVNAELSRSATKYLEGAPR